MIMPGSRAGLPETSGRVPGRRGTLVLRTVLATGMAAQTGRRLVAVEVLQGRTGDPATRAGQAEKLKQRSGLTHMALVGDRGCSPRRGPGRGSSAGQGFDHAGATAHRDGVRRDQVHPPRRHPGPSQWRPGFRRGPGRPLQGRPRLSGRYGVNAM